MLESRLMLIWCNVVCWGWVWGSRNGGFRGVHVFPLLSAQSVWPQLLLGVRPAVKILVNTPMNGSLPSSIFPLSVWFSVVFGVVKRWFVGLREQGRAPPGTAPAPGPMAKDHHCGPKSTWD